MGSPLTIEALREEIAELQEELRRHARRSAGERARLQLRIDALIEQATAEARRADQLRVALDRERERSASFAAELGQTRREQDRLNAAAQLQRESERVQAAELAATQQLLAEVTSGIEAVRGDVGRIAESRAWRVGHGLARTADRLTLRRRVTHGAVARAIDRLEKLDATIAAFEAPKAGRAPAGATGPAPPAKPTQAVVDPAAGRDLAQRVRSQLGPPPKRGRWPLVSIVVLNRNGESHLRRLLPGLTRDTDYPNFELIVVDNSSTDGSREYLDGLRPPFRLRLIVNSDNRSFSAANNQGATEAEGELLLFLNNDIEPFEKGWLRELVAAAERPGVGAAGATLLHARELSSGRPLVQHRGIRVRFRDGRLMPFNLDDGEPLFGDHFGLDVDAPASTGACLMIARDRFQRLGGFPDGYRYGTEDVDLGLQVVASGASVLTSGRSLLVHAESSTQDAEGREFKRLNRLGNQRLFAERWGSRLRREYRLSRLDGDPYWTGARGPHIAITLTSTDPAGGWGDYYTGHELGDALEGQGWQVTYVQRYRDEWYTLPEDLDYLLVLLDSYDLGRVSTDALTIAWVRNWTERWIERESFTAYDMVLASSPGSAEVIAQRTGIRTVPFPLATNPERFQRVAADPALVADLVFTGNYWNRPRDIQGFVPREGERLRVFGSGWDDVPELAPYAEGSVPYERLPAVYSSAPIVIDDTALHALPYGAVNSRVFDALSCGALVVTNCQAGAANLFDDEFPTWSDAASLRALLDKLGSDAPRRRELAERYRRVVREQHTYQQRARQLTAALADAERRLSFCVKTGAPNRRVAAEWGDVHFAEALARELRRRGHRCLVQVLDEWEELGGMQYDVVVHLKGLSAYTPKPGQFNVLWCISHPEKLTDAECEAYDLVCVASARFAAELAPRITKPVVVLEQATDVHLFYPQPDPAFAHELLFVANSRKVMRRIVKDLLPTEHELAVYGTNWHGLIDERYIAGLHVPNQELRRAYSSASIVLNDHWDDMREHGFVSNRVYDALACGATVLSDDLPELAERFADSVVTYAGREQLAERIEWLLGSPEERARRGQQGREAVLAGYTFERRTDELLAIVADHVPESHRIAPHRAAEQGTRGGRSRRRPRRWPWGRSATAGRESTRGR